MSIAVIRTHPFLIVMLLVLQAVLHSAHAQERQFYPNGRYGRKDSMPPLSEISGNREMTISFFGDGVVQCVYTGYSDYYKCGRKIGSSQSFGQSSPSVMD